MVDDYQKALSKSGLALQPHQTSGVEAILGWHSSNHGGIVADEMGLGKTCQAIATITILQVSKPSARTLVISPLSVVDHWETELKRFAFETSNTGFGLGKLHVKRYDGTSDFRNQIRKEMEESDWNVLLTSYNYVIRDSNYFTRWSFTTLIFDEAHRLKSSTSLLHEIVREMKVDWMILMTGTPVQNNLNELYSLLVLVDKRRFLLNNVDKFVARYKDTDSQAVVDELRALLFSYLLRRTKEELAIKIPPSKQVIIYHGISDMQKDLYRAILRKNYSFFEGLVRKAEDPTVNKTSLLNVMMQLRKCVLHPYLFEGVEPEPFVEGEHLVEASGKLSLLDRLLKLLKANGHRVLIFSQMTRVLDIVQDFLTFRGWLYERLDGSVRAEERYAALHNFQRSDAKTFCFLLSTRAGGVGLNLTGADTVIFLDSDFNPQNDIQAAARCHRIGQTKPVKVIRLIAKHTVEEVIEYRANRKLRMTQQVLGSKELEKENMTAVEISNMILYGLGYLNEKGGDNEGDISTNDKLETIIGKSYNGEWLVEDVEKSPSPTPEATSKENLVPAGSPDREKDVENFYVFEGHDYRKDREVLKEIVVEGQTDAAETREVHKPISYSAEAPHVSRTPLTKEQIEERARKRAETLKRKRELKLQEMERKVKTREEKKRNLWKKNNYTTYNLPSVESEEEQEEEAEEFAPDEDASERYGPFYVVGDVTKPKFKRGDATRHAIIGHVVDDSGSFGRGGLFNALRAKSSRVVEVYELAGRMHDLKLGDAVLIEGLDTESHETVLHPETSEQIDNSEEVGPSTSNSGSKHKESVVLLVAQHARRRDQISQEALSKSLSRLATYVKKTGEISVHLPRIGYGMQNVQWYGVERLIRKHLILQRIPTYVYYYRRGSGTGEAHVKKKRIPSDSSLQSSDSDNRHQYQRESVSSRSSASRETEKIDVDESEEEESETDNESITEEEADISYGESSSEESVSKPRSFKRSRKEPGTIFKNIKICIRLLDDTERLRYTDIVKAQDGIVVYDYHANPDINYILVDSSISEEELGNIKKVLASDCKIVTKAWVDNCFDERKVIDAEDFDL